MGYLFKGVCYHAIESARQHACSASSLAWGSGDAYYSVDCISTNFTDEAMVLFRKINGISSGTVLTGYPPFPDCDFSGGVDLGLEWLSAAMAVIAMLWGIRRLISLFSVDRVDS
jgi:hypothetical protein